MVRVFIGYDSREPIAYHVLAHSILSRATCPVAITPLTRLSLGNVYTRPPQPNESTEFSFTRFLVPWLSDYRGLSVFMDCDMLCRMDVASIYEIVKGNPGKLVFACQHFYTPKTESKFLGQTQTAYPRKNWSSFMIFQNELCLSLTPEYVNTASAKDLHQFGWAPDGTIGALPLDLNWLVGEYPPRPEARILHYTLGGPWFHGYEDCDHADLWRAEQGRMLAAR